MIPTSRIACANGGALVQLAFTLLLAGMLLALRWHGGTLRAGLRDLDGYMLGIFAATLLLFRALVRRLPSFLA